MPGVPKQRVAYFEAYLARPFVPQDVLAQLRALVKDVEDPASEPAPDRPSEPTRKEVARLGSFWANLFHTRPDAPEELVALRDRAIELHKRQSQVHPNMATAAKAGDKKQAYLLARELMEDIIPALDSIYDSVRTWQETGKLPSASAGDKVVADTVRKMQRIEYCKQRQSRIRRWLKDGFRSKLVDGKYQDVALTEIEKRELDDELLERKIEEAELREELGI